MSPIDIFKTWYSEELKSCKEENYHACCLSTVGLDGFPNARFVSLKAVKDDAFIITGPLNSKKGLEIGKCAQVALTFWWPQTKRQIRIQGTADFIAKAEADLFFKERNRDSQLVSRISLQGEINSYPDQLIHNFETESEKYKKTEVPRPANWGGISIKPLRIELMVFKESRFHDRKLYIHHDGIWQMTEIQP